MIEGVDFCYIYPKNDATTVHIKFLQGPYKDTVFKYGKVKIKEESDGVHLLFAYDVLESQVKKPAKYLAVVMSPLASVNNTSRNFLCCSVSSLAIYFFLIILIC